MEQETTTNSNNPQNPWQHWEQRSRRGKIIGGIILISIGVVILLRRMGIEFPEWLFTWPMIPIVIGIYSGFKNNFRSAGFLIPIAVGLAFLLLPAITIHQIFWPGFFILLGAVFIVNSFRVPRWRNKYWNRASRYPGGYPGGAAPDCGPTPSFSSTKVNFDGDKNSDDYLEVNSFLGAVNKTIISKNFRGAEINAIMGGAEINMSQADFEGQIKIELNAIMGGCKLIVPSHWQIKSELNAVLGGIDDKRMMNNNPIVGSNKVLLLEGNCILGGIEITSY